MKTADDAKMKKRVAANIAKMLSDLLKLSADFERKSKRTRLKINSDLSELVKTLHKSERDDFIKELAKRVQEIFDAAGSPKVEFSQGCAGAEGAGIRVTDGGSFAGVCATGSLSEGVTGGGVEAGFSY